MVESTYIESKKTLFEKITQAVEDGNDEFTREALDDNNASINLILKERH